MTTRALLTARENLADTTAARAITCIHSGTGSGKTAAVTSRLHKLEPDQDIRRATFHTRPTLRTVRRELHAAPEPPGHPPPYAGEFDQLLKTELAAHPRTLALDEAHRLSGSPPEYVRYIRDDPYTRLTIVFAGGEDCHQTPRKKPMPSSRTFIRQRLTHLTPHEAQDVIPLHHPIRADTDPEDIAHADQHPTHGNFRNRPRPTAHTHTALEHTGRTHIDQEVPHRALNRPGPGNWTTSPPARRSHGSASTQTNPHVHRLPSRNAGAAGDPQPSPSHDNLEHHTPSAVSTPPPTTTRRCAVHVVSTR
ncbi:ATP-binding protein [Embleya sp. AB8]|uniref:ATP-binding protein n=1 Tax=Embleya sp. AB8 TaxID=3156304 RepID=UPI003C71FE12